MATPRLFAEDLTRDRLPAWITSFRGLLCPELDCVVANLELLPLRVNESKNSTIGARQRDVAKKLHNAGLLSEAGLRAVLSKP